MGSDHYCLRWNNHQSNLLGVFSQLLRDESLVDVTLACSEGHSIRAHKVVLSACSSYFQTLFIDHPARHPIVILKDVRFAELSTLIEFMYHGEVNVEHCQLSELLRTAESLKVKGLTDMTNLGPPPVNLQTTTQHGNTCYTSSTSTSTSSGTMGAPPTCCKTDTPDNIVNMVEPEQTEPTELINKKPTHNTRESDPMVTATTTCTTSTTALSVTPITLASSERRSTTTSADHQPTAITGHEDPTNNNKDSPTRLTVSPHASSSVESETLRPGSRTSDMDDELDESDEEPEGYKPSDMRLSTAAVNSVPRDSMLGHQSGNSISSLIGRLPSPLIGANSGEPIAGPSNVMPPVQQVPLSLKKEVDWGGGSADEKSNMDSPSDYPRHSLDPSVADVERCFITTSPVSSSRSTRSPQHSSRSSTPAAFNLGAQAGHSGPPLPSSVSIAAAVVGYHQQHHHNLTSSLLEAGLVHPALFNAAAAAAAVAAAGVAAAGGSANNDDLFRCGACMAAFPSIWLLEQHTALQHIGNLGAASTSSSSTDKPFVCEQCGQSYRYRSAYVKHREQNHRARLPADKLFSCDFCGMQFRYLKSFKKHRLNHALERLHGKANSETRLDMLCGSGVPSGSKETTTCREESAPIENSSDQVSSSNETLTVVDDQPIATTMELSTTTTTTADYSQRAYRLDSSRDSPHSHTITDIDDVDNDNENPSTSGQHEREHIVVDSDPMQLATTSDEDDQDDQDDTIDSAAAPAPAEAAVGLKCAPVTSLMTRASQSPINVALPSTSSLLPSLAQQQPSVAGGSAGLATVDAVEAFRSAQQASIINFLRADAAERQRERRFACPFCGKCVRSKENLKLHVRKHTGERPFVCLFCGRAFGGKSDLTRHLRIHTGERPYHCDMCGKCFARADYLSKHLTTHINTPR